MTHRGGLVVPVGRVVVVLGLVVVVVGRIVVDVVVVVATVVVVGCSCGVTRPKSPHPLRAPASRIAPTRARRTFIDWK